MSIIWKSAIEYKVLPHPPPLQIKIDFYETDINLQIDNNINQFSNVKNIYYFYIGINTMIQMMV